MMGFIIKKVVVSFGLFVIETYTNKSARVFRNNSLPIKKTQNEKTRNY